MITAESTDTLPWSPDDQPTRNDANGRPYIGYYVPEEHLSFLWDGHTVVQVSKEMGEPILWTFYLPLLEVMDAFPPAMLIKFRHACDRWIEHVYPTLED